jgi:YVTN family beta-propeller protein
MARTRTAARLLALAIVGVTAMPAFAAPFAYITNTSSNNVSVIDTSTNTVVATVPVGATPLAVAVNPAGSRAYVANLVGNSVSVIDTTSNTVVATVAGVDFPQGIALNPAGTFAYVTNAHLRNVSVIDTASNTVVASLSVNYYPVGVAVNPAGTRAYVVHNGDFNVIVFDTSTNTQVATVPVGPFPYGVAVHPAGTRVYVTNTNSNNVSVIDTATNSVIATVAVGTYPIGVAFNPAGSFAYVANAGSSSVSVIDTTTNIVVATVAVGVGPRGVAVNPAGTFAYVANQFSNNVSVIDTGTNTVVATVSVGGDPYAFGLFIGGPLVSVSPTEVININDSGAGSLRDAINYVNANCSGQTISFNIPGAGPHVITPQSELPAISCNISVVDGYTQPGAQLNTAVDGTNDAVILVEIDGSACPGTCSGLTTGNSVQIRGLAIHSFSGAQIYAHSSAQIFGNYIGTDAAGVARGGTDGIVNDSGFLQLGSGPGGDMNFITGLTHAGVWALSFDAEMLHNQIGGRRNGTAGSGNGVGILLDNGQNLASGNFVRFNAGAGIVVSASNTSRNIFSMNSTFGNGGPGIDLNGDGPTPNDEAAVPYDTDSGPNQLVNYPVITAASQVGADTIVSGYLKSASGANASIELYSSSAAPPAGITQGETPVASFALTLDSNGFGSFTQTIPGFLADNISATTTTDLCNDGCTYSSEYSPSFAVGVPPVSLTPSGLAFAARTVGTTSALQTVTLANNGTGPLAINSIIASGDFAFTSDCPASLAPSATCVIGVTFTPVVAGTRTGSITITTDDAGSPHTIVLSGVGLSGAAPVVDASPTVLEFAPQGLGTQSEAQLVVIINAGNARLDFRGVTSSDGFILLPDVGATTYQRCGAAINSGSVCAFAIIFAPTVEGLADGVLTIFTNAAQSPTQIRLLGTGVVTTTPRTLSVPQSLSLGSQPVGMRSAGSPMTITNNGASPAAITELSATGDFSVSDTCASIPANASCAPLVFFLPTATGDRGGTLTIRTFSETQPYVVALAGVGTFNAVPQITLSVTRLGFGNTLVGVPTSTQLVITNVGQVPVAIESVLASGDFFVVHSCGTTIAVASTCMLNVSFFPRMIGASLGSVEIRTNAFGSPHDVQVSGVGCALPSRARARSGQPLCGR